MVLREGIGLSLIHIFEVPIGVDEIFLVHVRWVTKFRHGIDIHKNRCILRNVFFYPADPLHLVIGLLYDKVLFDLWSVVSIPNEKEYDEEYGCDVCSHTKSLFEEIVDECQSANERHRDEGKEGKYVEPNDDSATDEEEEVTYGSNAEEAIPCTEDGK